MIRARIVLTIRDCGAILLLVAAIVAPYLLAGTTFLPLNMPSVTPTGTYESVPKGGLTNYTLDLLGSSGGDLAWGRYTAKALSEGEIPYWNPYQGLGAPFLAEGGTAVLYPPNVLRLVLPPKYWDAIGLLHLLLTCLFIYFLAREMGQRRGSAIAAAAAMLANGFYLGYLPTNAVIETITWVPLLLYGAERTLRDRSAWAGFVPILLAVFFIGTGGHPGPAVFTIVGFAAYVALRIAGEIGIRRQVIRLAAPCFIGAMLSAPSWIQESAYVLSNADSFQTYKPLVLQWYQLPALVFPYVFGPIHTSSLFADGRFADTSYWYFGWIAPVAVFLALAGLIRGCARQDSSVIAMGVVIAVFVLWALNVFPFNLLRLLPVFQRLNTAYIFGLPGILLCALAGYGTNAMQDATRLEWRTWLIYWFALQVGITGCVALAALTTSQPVHWNYMQAGLGPALLWSGLVPIILYLLAWGRTHARHWVWPVVVSALVLEGVCYFPSTAGFSRGSDRILLVVMFAIAIALASAQAIRSRPVLWKATVATLAGAVLALSTQVVLRHPGWPKRTDPFVVPAFVQWLKAKDAEYRTYGVEGALMPNFGSAFGLSTINFLGALTLTASSQFIRDHLDKDQFPNQFYGRYFLPEQARMSPLDAYARNRRAWNYVGVRYVAAPDDALNNARFAAMGLRMAVHDAASGVRVWADSNARPRLYLAPRHQIAGSQSASLEAFFKQNDLRATAFFESRSAPVCPQSDVRIAEANPLTVRDLDVEPNYVRATIAAKSGGTLVLVDAYSPGWGAHIDGVPAEVYRVNGVFRGICLRAPGEYRIDFFYEPPLWNVSLRVAAAGLLLLLAAGLMAFYGRRIPSQLH